MQQTRQFQQTIFDSQYHMFGGLDLILRLKTQLYLWHERSKQRRQLAGLSEELLKDIGLTSADVKTESCKFFWQQ